MDQEKAEANQVVAGGTRTPEVVEKEVPVEAVVLAKGKAEDVRINSFGLDNMCYNKRK